MERPSRRVLLVTHRGSTASYELPARGTVVVGRAQGCELVLDDPQVSRKHARLHVYSDRVELEDLGSHNGTLVLSSSSPSPRTASGEELRLAPRTPTVVATDALIRVGTALITIATSSPAAPAMSSDLVVVAPALQRVIELADRVAATNLTVLLLGESGTGKDVIARYLHARSPRTRHAMVNVNCGALPETLLESELFGHEKGAFTGATATKPGLLEAADRGTLFLDEVGELSPALQVKLLRVVEDRQVTRVGALAPRAVDVRFVAATNRDLGALIAAGHFREDLFYRLAVVELHLPPLRERSEDIIPLAQRFIETATQVGAPRFELDEGARDKLERYAWPGNVRELRNVIERALALASGPRIGPDDLDLRERAPAPGAETPSALRRRAEDAERREIIDALEQCGGNQTRAARQLGLTRRALVRRLEKYNLPRPRR